jgi:selenocysteine lyase/cysteine desulfurase
MRGATWTGEQTFAPEPTARRYEGWELPYALVLGQSEAARYARGVGIETASRRAWALAERLRAGLQAIPGARVLDRGTTRCAIVTVAFERATAHALVRALGGRGINCVISLLEYSRYDFTDKAVDAAIRLSPHYYNTEAEIDATLAALEEESR